MGREEHDFVKWNRGLHNRVEKNPCELTNFTELSQKCNWSLCRPTLQQTDKSDNSTAKKECECSGPLKLDNKPEVMYFSSISSIFVSSLFYFLCICRSLRKMNLFGHNQEYM